MDIRIASCASPELARQRSKNTRKAASYPIFNLLSFIFGFPAKSAHCDLPTPACEEQNHRMRGVVPLPFRRGEGKGKGSVRSSAHYSQPQHFVHFLLNKLNYML